jgi:microcystin-dependent protein
MEPLLGQIELFPYGFAPRGWMACQGQLLPISENTALFSLFGVTFGGDGQSTFALPNMSGKEPLEGTAYYIAIEGIYPSRN